MAGPGHPVAKNFDPEVTAKIYGMVENIDDNVGRVLAMLDQLKLTERTIVILMTDNGPQQSRYKVIQPQGNAATTRPPQFGFQLYDMVNDPLEQRNVAAVHPEIVKRMTSEYEAWFRDVTGGRDYADRGIARISIGSPQENPVRLTRQDWRGAQAGWTSTSLGHWEVDVRRRGVYDVTLRFAELNKPGTISFALGERRLQKEVTAGATTATFRQIRLAPQAGRLESWVTVDDRRIGLLDVVVKHVR